MRNIKLLFKTFMVTLVLLISSTLFAQPVRHPHGNLGDHPPMSKEQIEQFRAKMQARQKKVQQRSGNTFSVEGIVLDSNTREPLAYLNVAILDSNNEFVKGAPTNEQGHFIINGIYEGNYNLRVTYIGYQNRIIPFNVKSNTNIGKIKLIPGSHFMKEVSIVADRPLYAMDGEKTIYNVSDDPSIQTGTTTDALQNAPGVEVDMEGNITLRGVSSVEIWINDKPSRLTEDNLHIYLEALPANALARIETITNPSSKYATDAEAVINIITSAHIEKNQFFSFGVKGTSQPNAVPWLSYMWAKDKLSINLYANGVFTNRYNTAFDRSTTRIDNATGDGYDTVKMESNNSESYNKLRMAHLGFNIDYQIDTMTDLSGWFMGIFNHNLKYRESHNECNEFLNNMIRYYDDTNDYTKNFFMGNLGADLTHKFNNDGHNIRFGIGARFNNINEVTWYDRIFTPISEDSHHKYYNTHNNSCKIDADIRYNLPYSLDGELSFGLRYDHDYDNDIFDRSFVDANGNFLYMDTLRQYTMRSNEDRLRADANITQRWNGFTLSAGIGGGWERNQYCYTSEWFPDDNTHNFFTVNPSLHLSYRTKSMHNFKLNYSMKSKTPSIGKLTTFRDYDEDYYTTGNPDLKNYYTHNAEAGWTKFFKRFGSVGAEIYARYSANDIDMLTDSKEDQYLNRWIKYSVPYNMGSSYRYGASANITYRPTGFINVRLYANVFDYGYQMDYEHGDNIMHIQDEKWSWSTRLNVWAKIFDQLQLTVSGYYSSPTIGLMSESKGRYGINAGIKSDFFKRRLSLFLNVRDIFNWGKKVGGGVINTNPYFLSESNTYITNGRFISLGLSLRFGKMELARKAEQPLQMSAQDE